jgi:membrane associated rhomboid family serine protease
MPDYSLATFVLLAANVITSLIAFAQGRPVYEQLWFEPFKVYRNERPYTIITSGFIHADWGHLLFNMISFYFFGFALEAAVGSINLLLIYFGSLVAADLPALFKYKNDVGYKTLGASGAVSGVMFGYILYEPLSRIYLFIIPVGIPAAIFGVLYLAGSYVAAKRQFDNVNHEAHFWGALAGATLTAVLNEDALSTFYQKIFG